MMKQEELQKYMREHDIDYSLLFYFTNSRLRPNYFYFSQHFGEGCYLIPQNGKGQLVLTSLEAGERQAKVAKGRIFDYLSTLIPRKSTVGIDKDNITYPGIGQLKKSLNARLENISETCVNLRMTKTEEEIDKIQKSCKITKEILEDTVSEFHKFRTESDVHKFLKINAIERDCEVSFNPIVASGKNAAIPHHRTDGGRLRRGFTVIDFGVRHNGYCSDITRTVFYGKPTNKEKDVFKNNIETEWECIEKIKEGVSCEGVHGIAKRRLGNLLVHATGHGVGIEVHEKPTITDGNKDRFMQNMVVCVEPGSYVLGKFGVRTEDMIVVERKSARLITKPQGFIRV